MHKSIGLIFLQSGYGQAIAAKSSQLRRSKREKNTLLFILVQIYRYIQNARCSLKLHYFCQNHKHRHLQAFPDNRSNYIHQEGARGPSSRPMRSPSFSHGIDLMLERASNWPAFRPSIAGQKHLIWSSIGELLHFKLGIWSHRISWNAMKRLQWNNSTHCIDNRLFLPENSIFGLKSGSYSHFRCSWCSFSVNLRFCEPH